MAYKRCLTATTKNLFDGFNDSNQSGYQCTFENIFDYGFSIKKSVEGDNTVFGAIRLKGNFESGKTYTISWSIIGEFEQILFAYKTTDGTGISFGGTLGNLNIIITSEDKDGKKTITLPSSNYEYLVVAVYFKRTALKDEEVKLDFFQIVEGNTSIPFSPKNHLVSYKKIIKINNNPVQLLDKSKFNSTNTVNGVTFTNNGDGSITVNGKAAANTTYVFRTNGFPITHKYLLSGCPDGGNKSTFNLSNSTENTVYYDIGSGVIFDMTGDGWYQLRILVYSGVTVNNLTFKPQLYDLTAMFGEGNEPSTVAEFRVKYPNDYYEYNPSQYLISYQKNLITDGSSKNLFDIDSVSFFTKDSNGEYKSNKRIVESDILWKPADGTKQVTISGYIKCPVGNKYMFMITYTDGTESWQNLESTGNYIYQAITSNSSKVVSFIGLTYYNSSDQVYIKDVQIEYGPSATSYVPYQYL